MHTTFQNIARGAAGLGQTFDNTAWLPAKILDLARLQTREKIGNFDIYVEELALTLLTLVVRILVTR